MLRILNALVIVTLVVAAAWVYKIKFDSTVDAQRVAKLRVEIRHERDMVARLRADWAQLDRPDRIQALSQRFLTLKPVEVSQFDQLDKLPERPVPLVPPGTADPIGAIIENFADTEVLSGNPLPNRSKR
jgi:hypothetical protein